MAVSLKSFVSVFVLSGLAVFGTGAAVAVYSGIYSSVSHSFEAKAAGLGEVVGAVSNLDDIVKILSISPSSVAKSSLYMRYHEPMAASLRDSGATYLYIYRYGGSKDLQYAVDAYPVDSEDWCAPNFEETSADSDLKDGLFHAFRSRGGMDGIFRDRQWGLMRSGSYPINRDGERSFYLVGVDVAIGEIVSRAASVMTWAALVFALIAGISFWITGRLSDSFSRSAVRIKNGVLRFGVGAETSFGATGFPSEMGAIAAEIGAYAALVKSRVALISAARQNVTTKALSARLNAFLSVPKSDFEFCVVEKLGGNTSHYGGEFFDGNFYVWSFDGGLNDVRDILIDAAVRARVREGAASELCASDFFATFAKFGASGNPIFFAGCLPTANFSRVKGFTESVSFVFPDGTSAAFSKGINQ